MRKRKITLAEESDIENGKARTCNRKWDIKREIKNRAKVFTLPGVARISNWTLVTNPKRFGKLRPTPHESSGMEAK